MYIYITNKNHTYYLMHWYGAYKLTYLFNSLINPWNRVIIEANRFAVSQEIPRILWNRNVHYRNHKCPLPVS
jgi:hypothetical protein